MLSGFEISKVMNPYVIHCYGMKRKPWRHGGQGGK